MLEDEIKKQLKLKKNPQDFWGSKWKKTLVFYYLLLQWNDKSF